MVQASNPQAPGSPKMEQGPVNYSTTEADLESLRTRRRESRRKQVKIVALLVALLVLGVVLQQTISRTFFSVRTPKVRFSSVSVLNSTTTGGGDTSAPSFRIRLEAQVTIKNTNFGKFEYYYSGYGNLTVGVYYRGAEVGEGVIAEGTAGARKTKRFDVTLDLSSTGLTGNSGSDLRNDVNSGSLALSSKAKITGIVDVIRIVRKNREPELSCTMTVKLDSKTVQDLVCM